ncbi:hypothetical protein HV310_19890 [Citrobacter freundii]|nr:hypothetical protein [Citrobacter freundii]QMR46850.1 hypothetical protein HV310_19890 [Citrobacter freundii]
MNKLNNVSHLDAGFGFTPVRIAHIDKAAATQDEGTLHCIVHDDGRVELFGAARMMIEGILTL